MILTLRKKALVVASTALAFLVAVFPLTPVMGQGTSGFVDLVYQSNSYVPAFYEGRALPSSDTRVVIVATPFLTLKNGRAASAKDLVYTWEKNGLVLGAQSGPGKQTLAIRTNALPGEPVEVGVTVKASDGSSLSRSLVIAPISPVILLYENDPLLGVRAERTANQGFVFTQPEVSLIAYPFYFETLFRNNPILSYTWLLNGAEVKPKEDSPTEIIMRRGGSSGDSSLRVTITNPSKVYEVAAGTVPVSFAENTQSPF